MSLRKIRRAQDITQARLAELTGVDQTTISDLECGHNTNPTWTTVTRLAEALGVTPQDLFPITQDDTEAGAA